MKESVKSFIMVSLTGLLIVLIGTLWFEPVRGYELPKDTTKVSPVTDVSYLIDVASVNIVDGDQIKTFFCDVGNLFNYLKPYIVSSMMNMNQALAISGEQYYAAQSGHSAEFIMRKGVTSELFLEVGSNSDIIFKPRESAISAIVVNDKNQLFFRAQDRYYQLENNDLPRDCGVQIANLDIDDAVVYNTIEKQLKIESNRPKLESVLLPSAVVADFTPVKVISEVDLQREEHILAIADKVFGSRINFVRRFFDVNGSVVMLYGYGERALKVSPDGTVIVEQKIDADKVEDANLLKDIKLAYDIVNSYGEQSQNLYLKSVSAISKDDIAGFSFDFGYKINDYDVISFDAISGVRVEVVGGQLSSYKRHYKAFYARVDNVAPMQTLPIFSIMNNQANYDVILADFAAAHPDFINDERAFMQILTAISGFKMVYIDRLESLVPAYCLAIDESKYYFDARDFSLIEKDVR